MAYEQITSNDNWQHLCRGVLINGAPYTGKTTSLLTFPATKERKRAIVVAPGELGHSSIRPSDSTLIFHNTAEPKQQTNWIAQVSSLENQIDDLIQGKYGPLNGLFLDGAHQAFRAGMYAKGWTETSDPREFTKYHKWFEDLCKKIIQAPIPYRGITVYDSPEAQDPLAAQKEMKWYPSLPGKMAREVMGLFPLALHTFVFAEGTKQKQYMWHIQPTESVKGAGMHLPKEIMARMPLSHPQDFAKLERAIEEAAQIKTGVAA